MKLWLIEIFGIACGVSIVMSQSKLYAWLVNKIGGIKPFSCELCMAYWTYLLYAICNYGFGIESVLNAFICAYIGYLASTKFLKW